MKRLLILLSLVLCGVTLHASVSIDLFAGQLLTAAGAPLPDGSLIQLVASTSGDTFAAPTANSFTGGASSEVVVASFALNSTAAGSAGSFEKVLQLTLSGGLAAGDALLLRWYPSLNGSSSAPGSGASYGQFRTDAVVDGSTIGWALPGDGSNNTLTFATATEGGSQPNSAGEASLATAYTAPVGPPQITSATTATVVATQPFSYAIEATNSPTSYGASGLPAGVSLNAANGLLSGAAAQAGVYSVHLTATNAAGLGSATLTVTVDPAPVAYPVISSPTTATAVSGQPFTYQVTATNQPVSFAATGLPLGLVIDSTTGVITGVTIQVATFNVGLSASNSGGTGTASLLLTIDNAISPTPTPTQPPAPAPTPAPAPSIPVVTSVLTANGQADAAFAYQITADDEPTVFGATGLPATLSVDAATGLISGRPDVAGVYSVVLSATNATGTGTATLQLTIGAAPLPEVTIFANIPKVTSGTGKFGEFTLTLSKAEPTPVLIKYALRGTATNGRDFQILPGSKRFSAGQRKVTIKVAPRGDLDGAHQKVVTLILESSKGYTIGTTRPVKVKIVAGA